MNITLKQLTAFHAVARAGSLTQAADRLFISKSALSQSLAELESHLKVRLFDRQHARLYINNEGRKLLPVADELLARMQEVPRLFTEREHEQHFTLGCTRTIGSFLMPALLTSFEKSTGWLPRVTIANTAEIAGMLNNYEIDIALVEGAVAEPNLRCDPWLEDEMVVVACSTHPLARQSRISYATLSKERWLLREAGSSSRAFFDNQLALRLDNPQVALSLDAYDAILACVMQQLGITFISSRMLEHPFYKDHLIQLKTEHRYYRKFTLCYHRNKYLSSLMHTWMTTLLTDFTAGCG